MSIAERIYPYLPIWAQNLACSCYGTRERRIRFSELFDKTLTWLGKSEFWSASEILAYKDEQIKRIIKHAYDTVPYYRNLFNSRRLRPDDVKCVADLDKIPILTKDDIRAHSKDLVSLAYRRQKLVERHTSGTTGTSLQLYADRDEIAVQWAVWWRHRLRFDCAPEDLHVNFTGKPIVPIDQQKPPYWRYVKPQNQYVVNMHHITPGKIRDVVLFLNSVTPKFYSGYPSIISEVARLALEKKLTLDPRSRPKIIFAGAEAVQELQRRLLKEWTGAIITDEYGFTEGAGNASRCKQDCYHEDFEFGHLECGQPEDAGNNRRRGDVIATGFFRKAMPLIRYRVGDSAIWESPEFRCACGRNSAVILAIEGRSEDYVLTPEGRRIMRFDYIFKDTHSIREAQVCQCAPGQIVIKIVITPDYKTADEEQLRRLVGRWISPQLKVIIQPVKVLDREANGKLRAVKSTISTNS